MAAAPFFRDHRVPPRGRLRKTLARGWEKGRASGLLNCAGGKRGVAWERRVLGEDDGRVRDNAGKLVEMRDREDVDRRLALVRSFLRRETF